MSAKVVIEPSRHEFIVQSGETILEAALKSGLALDHGCTTGSCGKCKARLVSGEVKDVGFPDFVIPEAEKGVGYALLCAATPLSDVIIEAAEAKGPEDIAQQEISARVQKLERVREEVMLLGLRTPRSRILRFLAGQHVTVQFDGLSPRDIAVASCPCDGMNLRFHLRRVPGDPFSERVFGALRRSDTVEVRGPYGGFSLDEESRRPIVFLAFDIGFGPVSGLIEHAMNIELPQAKHLYWCAPCSEDHYLENYCRAWVDALDAFRYTPLAGGADSGRDAARRIMKDHSEVRGLDVYVVAPAAFAAGAKDVLVQNGLPTDRFFSDEVSCNGPW